MDFDCRSAELYSALCRVLALLYSCRITTYHDELCELSDCYDHRGDGQKGVHAECFRHDLTC